MKKILTTILLAAGVVCTVIGVNTTSIIMFMLGAFFLGVYNSLINMKGE